MAACLNRPVLIVGGTGVVGARVSRTLRRLQPDLPIAVGGRDPVRARAVADGIGRASAVTLDLSSSDLGQRDAQAFGAIVLCVRDDTLNALRFAQAAGIPYLAISGGAFEIAPEVALFAARPTAAPILLNATWLAGGATLAALDFAREFDHIESIRIGAVLDELDASGPAAAADFDRQRAAGASALVRADGMWRWADCELDERIFVGADGADNIGQPHALLDAACLAAAIDRLSDVRFDLTYGLSAGRRRGGPASADVVIEIAGRKMSGASGTYRLELVHPGGQASATAVGVAVATERLLGLVGERPAPGLYLPSTLIDPAYMLQRLAEFGATITRT